MTCFDCTLVLYRKPGWVPGTSRTNHTFKSIRASIGLVMFLLLALSSNALGADPGLDTVLNGSRQRIEKLDYRATGRLTKIGVDGKHTNYKFVAKAHWFPDGLRLLFETSAAGQEKTSLLLRMSASGRMTIEAALPGAKVATPVPSEHWSDPLMGTDFSYEDLVESQFFWKGQELLAPAKYGARDCFVLKSTPGSQDRTSYASVTSWIDRSILFPVHVMKTVRGTGQQKEFTSFGLRQNGGAWSASQLEAKIDGKPGSSLLVIEGGTPKANLGPKDFEIGQPSAH